MFSIDNFLFDHMPRKSRSLLDQLMDPSYAYWPGDYSWQCRRSPRKNLYKHWANSLMNEILDSNCSNEMEVEKPTESKPQSISKEQPMEVESAKKEMEPAKMVTNEKVECQKSESPKETAVASCSNEKSPNKMALQQTKQPTELSLRLSQFKPEDITVKVKDNKLTIRGRKEKKSSTSYQVSSFERTFTLPENVDHERMLCSMDANGLIKLNLPHKQIEEAKPTEQEIKIVHEPKKSDEAKPEETVASSSEVNNDDEPIVEDLIEE